MTIGQKHALGTQMPRREVWLDMMTLSYSKLSWQRFIVFINKEN